MMTIKRLKFVLVRAVNAIILALIVMYTTKLFGALIGSITAATLCLIYQQFGEIIGKQQAAGTFVDNFKGNKTAFIDSFDDKGQLWQTIAAATIGGGVMWFVGALL